jgi:IS30 family transposase
MRAVERTPWTEEEREQLRRLCENGLSQGQIGKMMGRSKHSVSRQMRNLGLAKNERNPVGGVVADRRHVRQRAPLTTLPPLPSLADDIEAKPWDGTGWPRGEDFWP